MTSAGTDSCPADAIGRKSTRWNLLAAHPDAAELAALANIPPLIAQLLLARGVRNAEDARRFLDPRMEDLHDPFLMRGMPVAVERVRAAVRNHEPVLIYGDYDVDGTTAVVLLKTAIEMTGGEVRFHVPHRLREGYGMQSEVIETAAAAGARLIISVDTGIRAFAAAETAARLGIDLIVTDHHLPEAALGLPRALAVLNPNQPDCAYPCKHLCGAGVAFKLAQALLEAHCPERARAKILPSFLKMLAIATVADAVPLLGENRTLVAIGMQQLARPASAGLRSLMQLARIDPAERRLTTTDIAFRLAPRINGAGRMDIASEVVELFTTRDAGRARELAGKLDRLNTERRAAEAAILAEIETRLKEDSALRDCRCIVLDGDGWHRGIIGILASRVVEQTLRPALVIAHEDGEAYGSGRSIPGFHLLNAIETCHDLFTRFGGHAHAVGFSLPSGRVPELRERMTAYAANHLSDEALEPAIECDGLLPLDMITPALYSWLRRLEPVGMSNEEPLFVARRARIASPPRILKERHVKLRLAQSATGPAVSALAWNWADCAAALGIQEGSIVDVAYRLRENEHPEFGGIELDIEDLVYARTATAPDVRG